MRDSIGGVALHLRGEVREIWFDWLREHRPDLVPRYEELYERGAYMPDRRRAPVGDGAPRPSGWARAAASGRDAASRPQEDDLELTAGAAASALLSAIATLRVPSAHAAPSQKAAE